MAALLNVSAWMGLTTASLLWLPAGQAATLAYTMPIWATLLAWPMLNERPSLRQVGAIALGICGVVILITGAGLNLNTMSLPGIALALCAAGLFGFGTVLFKRMPILLPHITLTAWQVILGCIPLLGCGLLFEHAHFDTLPLVGWIALAYAATISMGLCYLLWFAAVRRLKASTAAIGTLLTPVVGVASSSLALGDPLLLGQILSLGLIAIGVALTNQGVAGMMDIKKLMILHFGGPCLLVQSCNMCEEALEPHMTHTFAERRNYWFPSSNPVQKILVHVLNALQLLLALVQHRAVA